MSASYFLAAEEYLPSKIPKASGISEQNSDHSIFRKVALDAQWLLSKKELRVGSVDVQKRYFNVLLKQGFAYYNGRLRHNKLLAGSRELFSPECFSSVGAITKKETWVIILANLVKQIRLCTQYAIYFS
jgi:hypothetical protein